MFQKLRIVAMVAAVAAPLFATGGGFGGGGLKIGNPVTASNNAGYGGMYAYNSVATTAGAVVTLPTLMTVKTQKILGLVSAVTAEMAESMGSGVGGNVANADAGTKIAGSSGSMHRAATWLRAAYGGVDNKATGQQWNGHSYLLMLGFDYRFNHIFGAGLGLSYAHLDVRTEFNKGTMKEETWGVNPFLLVKLHKNFNVSAVAGWNHAIHDDKRQLIYDEPNPVAGQQAIKHDTVYGAKPKMDNIYGGLNATFVSMINKTSFSATVGYLWMQTKVKAFSERVISSASGSAAAIARDAERANSFRKDITYKKETVHGKIIAGYQMTPSVMPFISVHGLYNTKQSEVVTYQNAEKYKDPRSAFGGGFGFHANTGDQFKTSLQFDYTKAQDLSTYVTALRFHYAF